MPINPPLPFTTSALQQSANTNLRISPKATMKICQKLYVLYALIFVLQFTGALIFFFSAFYAVKPLNLSVVYLAA